MLRPISEDCAGIAWDLIVANDLWIFFLYPSPFLPHVLFHLDLKEVLRDFIPPDFRETRILNQYSRRLIVFYYIGVDYRRGLRCSQDTTSLIRFDHVLTDEALRVNEDNAVVIPDDLVVFNEELLLSLDHEDALRLAVLDIIVLYPSKA